MKYLNVFILMFLAVAPYACNREESPETEEKKNIISLESEGAFNIFAEEHDMATADADGYTNGYITAAIGGVLDNTDPITLSLSEDPALLEAYNKSAFGAQSYQYAQIVPPDRYAFENQTITFQQGKREMQFKLRVKTVGLSPDVSYFIPLRIDKTTASEYDLKKSTILYRIYLKNDWASTLAIPKYSHIGQKTSIVLKDNEFVSGTTTNTSLEKEVFPVSANGVRTLLADRTVAADENRDKAYSMWGIRLSVAADGKVTITPWSDDPLCLNITMLDTDPDYPNRYELITEGGKAYQCFRLYYSYVDADIATVYYMKEVLRIEEE
ncbi:MAG: DUF4361 domain-containing protein [Bacteroidales bacterium]|jgi:hypothetical protein|nr:DUF4361 domain-containing protein [Bacteroidales bacterium]